MRDARYYLGCSAGVYRGVSFLYHLGRETALRWLAFRSAAEAALACVHVARGAARL